MAFVARTFEQILTDMVSHVRANTTLTDFTIGSVIRTILEAAALEDDEQYFQMVKLLDAFRIATSTGTDLDERAADFNLTRLSPKQAYGSVYILNDGLTQSELLYNALSGASSITLASSLSFPLTPPNYTIRLGEGTPQVEDLTVTNNSTTTGVLTLLTAVVNNHTLGERVAVVSGADTTIPRGVQVQSAPTTTSLAIKFSTIESGTIVAGNYQSGLIGIKAIDASADGNVPTGQISQFVSSPPFTGAGVTNPSDTTGGQNRESDDDFRNRLLRRYDELSRGTPPAIENAVIGVEDPVTGQKIATANLVENFITNEHTLYVDDGTGLVPSTVNMGSTTFSSPVGGGATSLSVTDASGFPSSGALLLSPGVTGTVELATYSTKGPGNVLVLDAPGTVNPHLAGEEILLVDMVSNGAEAGQNYFKLTNWPIVANSCEIYDNNTGEFTLRTIGTDLFLNRTDGEIQYYGSGLLSGTKVVANYAYHTGLLQIAQKVLVGDPDDPVTYPGVVAAGVIVYLDTPVIRPITVIVALSAKVGFDEATIAPDVKQSIASYIDGLRIGDDVYIAKIIQLAMEVPGVQNVIVTSPTSDITILENELPRSYDSSGNSLISVL